MKTFQKNGKALTEEEKRRAAAAPPTAGLPNSALLEALGEPPADGDGTGEDLEKVVVGRAPGGAAAAAEAIPRGAVKDRIAFFQGLSGAEAKKEGGNPKGDTAQEKMEPPKKTSGGAAEKDAPEKDDGEEKGKAPLDILEEAPRPPKRAYQVTKHRGLQSSTEFTGVGATTTAWNDIHLPTVKEFRAQSSVFLAKRGDGLKSIEGTLTAFHAAKEKGGVEKMEDRVVLYGALRQLAAACQAYMDSDPFFKKRRNAVERLAQQVDAAMESISGGGNTQAFDLASTQYQMEKDAYGGMGKEDFYQKYFGGDDEKRKEHSLNVSRISSQADKQEIADADRPYAQACAILGTIRGEEITNLKNQFESDPLMKSILEEQEAVRDKVHYVGTESGPKTFLARSGKENARYMAQLRLFDFSRYYGERLGCPADFAGHAQVDTVHENTHLVVNETFHTAGRSYSVPVDKLAEGDEEEQQRTMGEIKQVVQERYQSSQRLYELGNSYLNAVDSGELLPGQWEGWRAHRAELFHLQRQLGYSYVLESYSELGNNSRMLKSAKVVESAYEQHKKGELKDDSEFASNGYGDLVQDPKRMQAYLRFGYEAANQPSNKKEAVEAGMDPTTLFSNSLIEYDSTINECYALCKMLGVPPDDPLFRGLQEAAQDAYDYRKRFREKGEFSSVTSHKKRQGT